jgi:DNA-binding LacI/PurR family transcriptional regulator
LILPAMIATIPGYQEILDQITERIDNVVCLEEPIRDWPTVIFDRADAARQAVEHLINLGHRRIAFLAIRDERLTGYRQTLLDHDLPYDEGLVLPTDPTHVLSSAYQSTVEILQMQPRPSAIFAANDESAISAIAALHDHGVQVPRQIAITSIDNIGMAEMIRPSLTTVDVPKRRMAAYAMQVLMLQEQFKGQQSASIVLPTRLIVRESCGAKIPPTSQP